MKTGLHSPTAGTLFPGTGRRTGVLDCGRPLSLSASRRLKERQRTQAPSGARARCAFTLIELLVVIAVIAILASLVFPVTRAVNRAKVKSKVRSELTQIEFAIDAYKAKLGHYPPDNPGTHSPGVRCNHARNPLYFELVGTRQNGNSFQTLDGKANISRAALADAFPPGVGANAIEGFVNCTQGSGDEGHPAMQFLKDLKPGQVGDLPTGSGEAWKILVCSIPWPADKPSPLNLSPVPNPNLNPFRYNSSSPTNNPTTYDLWVDVVIDGKTNRFSNWSRDPQIVGSPL